MKKLFLCTIAILSISCSNEFTAENEFKQADTLRASHLKLDLSYPPIQDENESRIQIDALLSNFYEQSNFDPASIFSINQAIHPNGTATISLISDDVNITNSSIMKIRNVVSVSHGIQQLTVENPAMTTAAKASLSGFIQNIMLFSDDNYDSILQSVAVYESDITTNASYSAIDKDIMLTITSIANVSLFCERKRKDKDWETLVGNKPEDFILTSDITFKTVRMALLSGIIQDN